MNPAEQTLIYLILSVTIDNFINVLTQQQQQRRRIYSPKVKLIFFLHVARFCRQKGNLVHKCTEFFCCVVSVSVCYLYISC